MRARAGLTAAALLGALITAPAHASTCIPLPEPLNGTAALDALGKDLDRAASKAQTSPESLRQTLKTDPTLWLDTCSRPYFVEPASTTRERTFEPALDPSGDALALHSRPGSKRTIFLDFDGMDVTGTAWTESYGAFTAPGYSMDADPAFNPTERARIADVWLRVSEDYAPFNVDVTTQDPGEAAIDRANNSDDVYGTRVAIVGDNPIYKSCGCGGIAYVNVFDEAGDHGAFQPAFVFVQGLGTGSKNIAEATTHEAGHNLGLYHDGTRSVSYYRGQGLWAPIMGVGYYEPLSQWSKGEYANANRTEDDLAIIAASGAPRMVDDVGDARGTAADITPGTVEGLISTAADTDWFRFNATDLTTVGVRPQAVSPDLDVRIDLYDADGVLLASDDPASAQVSGDVATGLDATIVQVLAAGTYYVKVDGVGSGNPLETGYSDYASLGRYDLSMTTNGVPALVLTRKVLPAGGVDAPYSATFAATGGTAPYSFEVVSGTLPPGLSLSTAGELTGIPSAAGTSSFTVEVTDTNSASDRGTFTIQVTAKAVVTPPVVEPPPPAPPAPGPTTPTPGPNPTVTPAPAVRITTNSRLPKARVGKRYSTRLDAENAVNWQATGLPRGLRLTAGGHLAGRPKKAGTFTFAVTAQGSAGQMDAAQFTLKVRRAAR